MNPNEQIYLLKVENGKLKTKNSLNENVIEELKKGVDIRDRHVEYLTNEIKLFKSINNKLVEKLFAYKFSLILCVISLILIIFIKR